MIILNLLFGILTFCTAYENIALQKQAYQQYPFPGPTVGPLAGAENAVDGLKSNLSVWGGQCVISANEKTTATLWVNLSGILSINYITVYYRTGNVLWGPENDFASRFLGFSLYISNSTNKTEGKLCFKDTTFNISSIPPVFNTSCSVHGQYVIYYNERLTGVTYPDDYSSYAFNELCELEVFGCSRPGVYGNNCSIPCPDPHCRYCHIETGTCQGCKPGYTGHHCETACVVGYYGRGCVNRCISTCTGCNHVNGLCESGCIPGWRGDYCREPCQHGYFGQDCIQKCNSTCKGCDNANGVCHNGCHDGWKGSYCEQKCSNDTFGSNCSLQCGNCLESDQCFHVNGSCLEGCNPGFKGDMCITNCEFGYYGDQCLRDCSPFCKNSRECDHVSGFCIGGCKSGWQGRDCLAVVTASSDTQSDRSWKSEFLILIGSLCTTLFFFGLLIVYVACSRWNHLWKGREIPSRKNSKIDDTRESFQFHNHAAYGEYETPTVAQVYANVH